MKYTPVFEYIDSNKSNFVEDLVRICEVAAPTFREQKRARFFASLFEEIGFTPVIDEVGNVQVSVTNDGAPHVVLSAHLDTVFSFEEIKVYRDNTILRAPGISDDSAGLAALLFLTNALKEHDLPSKGSLTLLATVGEEGLGNLRGVKHFFNQNQNNIDYFISLDGSDAERVVVKGLASKRIRIFLRGPGGHSWGDAGIPNPIHKAGEFLFKISNLSLPVKPKTTLNVGTIQGGNSINAIPTEVFLDMDLRSEAAESLTELDRFINHALREITQHERLLTFELHLLGERPYGEIAMDHPLVHAAIAANQQFNLSAKPEPGSTDSNVPFALGIPALTLGVGGKSAKTHTPQEWYDIRDVEKGLKRTALLVLNLLHA